jgi:hypothetical protein
MTLAPARSVLRAASSIRYASWVDTLAGPLAPAAQSGPRARRHPFFGKAATMTAPVEHPQDGQHDVPLYDPRGEGLTDPVATEQAVQQLRAAGFSDDQQAALTTALLRVLALWTQQATRGDLQTELHTVEQRLAQQLDTLREDLRRESAQHADALREELRGAVAQQAALFQTTRTASARRWDGPLWLLTALLGLTCAGVLLLVLRSVLGW